MTITAVILCGGQGTRLQPMIGPDLPKCLAPVAGRPFLSYVLKHLGSQGVKKAILCLGHLSWVVEKWMDEISYEQDGVQLYCIKELEPLGTAGALRNALPYLDSDPVLVLNGDTYCPFNLEPMLKCTGNTVTVYEDSGTLGVPGKAAGVWLVPKALIQGDPEALQNFLDNKGIIIPGTGYQPKGLQFIDIGTPEGYAGAEGFLRSQGVIE